MRLQHYLKAGGRCLLPFCCFWLVSCASLENIARDLTDEIGVPMRRSGGLSHLPLERWLTRDSIRVRTIAFCREGECPMPVAAMVVEVSGEDAREIKALLADPKRIAQVMNKRNGDRRRMMRHLARNLPQALQKARVPAVVETVVQPLIDTDHRGFLISMHNHATQRQAHAVVFHRMGAGYVVLAVAVGATAEAAATAASRLAGGL